MEVRFCHMCGNKLQGNAKFCGACGTPVLQLTPSAPEPVQPEPVVAVPEPEPVQPKPVVVIPEPEPVQPEPAVVIPEPEPIQPEPTAVHTPTTAVPAPQPQEAPAPVAPVKSKKDRYPKRGAGRTILATLLCILIFLWSFAALVIFDVRQATTGDQLTQNLQDAVDDMDLEKLSAGDMIADAEDPDIPFVQWTLQQITDNYDGTVVASERDIEEFLERATFSSFLTQKASAYVNDVYTGSETSGVTSEELLQLLNENAPLVEEIFGHPLYAQDIEHFVQKVEDMGILENLSAKALEEDYTPVYYGVQIGISYWVVGFFGILAILFTLLLAKTNKWNLLRTSGDIGITLTVMGSLLVLAALFARILPNTWNSLFGSISIIGSLSGAALYGGILPALIITSVGMLLILIHAIGKMIVLKSAKKQVQ